MAQAAAPTALQLVQSNSLPALVQVEIEQLILTRRARRRPARQ